MSDRSAHLKFKQRESAAMWATRKVDAQVAIELNSEIHAAQKEESLRQLAAISIVEAAKHQTLLTPSE